MSFIQLPDGTRIPRNGPKFSTEFVACPRCSAPVEVYVRPGFPVSAIPCDDCTVLPVDDDGLPWF